MPVPPRRRDADLEALRQCARTAEDAWSAVLGETVTPIVTPIAVPIAGATATPSLVRARMPRPPCPWPGCTANVATISLAACARHWQALPKPLRAQWMKVRELHRVTGDLRDRTEPEAVAIVEAIDAWMRDHA